MIENNEDAGQEKLPETLDDVIQPYMEEEPAPSEEEVPEKYAGKSPKDLVRMLEESDSFRGRQANEVGELRKLVDTFILDQTKPSTEPEEPIDFYTDPDAALEQRLANNPTLKKMEASQAQLAVQAAQGQLRQKHPDMDAILSDSTFGEWVKGSDYRTRQLQQAHVSNDVTAADDLFSAWKERKELANITTTAETVARKKAVKNASTATGRGAAKKGGGKKFYKRQDLIQLRVNNPERYESMNAEILLAYQEGRVT